MDRKRTLVKDFLWAIVFAGIVAALLRFVLGLGFSTGLNDSNAWGLWIAFKLGFVAIAGGCFTIVMMVYILHLETYRPILRRAILLALLGYGSFIVSLIFDLGQPWHIYMPIIHWQHHSVMFEIAWCVMLYFSVLNMEFGPVILEHTWFQHPVFQWIARFLHKVTVPLVIAGIVLSTLHQSSLGSLFLIMPFRVHPLWYSPMIPVLFFVSAIGVGLMALVLEGFIAEKLFGRAPQKDLLIRLSKIASIVLWIYIAIRVGDLVIRGILPGALDGSWQSALFVGEILIGGILPASLLMVPRIRERRQGMIASSLLAIFGVVNYRMSLSMFTMWRPEGAQYIPSELEVIIAFAIPAAAGLIYLFFGENLAIFTKTIPVRERDPFATPKFDPHTMVQQEEAFQSTVFRRSGLAIVIIALAVALLPSSIVNGQQMPRTPVQHARGWEILVIDGNRADKNVNFPHVEHQERQLEVYSDGDDACRVCHHLSKPEDGPTSCWECHQDMYLPTKIFDHVAHQDSLGGNASCGECHTGEHVADTAKPCVTCHEAMAAEKGDSGMDFNYFAPSYKDAMHGKCIGCHETQSAIEDNTELAECATCHQPFESPDEVIAVQTP